MEELPSQVEFRFNWGALTLTPLWLIRNGFLLSFVLYILASIFVWPLSVAFSILFFVKGTEWSWGGGRRWKNHEEFAESQFAWSFVGKIILILSITTWLLVLYSQWNPPVS